MLCCAVLCCAVLCCAAFIKREPVSPSARQPQVPHNSPHSTGGPAIAKLVRTLREDVVRAIRCGALGGAHLSLLAHLLPALARLIQPGTHVTLPYDEVCSPPKCSTLVILPSCVADWKASAIS